VQLTYPVILGSTLRQVRNINETISPSAVSAKFLYLLRDQPLEAQTEKLVVVQRSSESTGTAINSAADRASSRYRRPVLDQTVSGWAGRQLFPGDAESFRDLGVVHPGMPQRQSATLALGPDHERVHRSLHTTRRVARPVATTTTVTCRTCGLNLSLAVVRVHCRTRRKIRVGRHQVVVTSPS